MRPPVPAGFDPTALLSRAIARHGGAERWARVERIDLDVGHLDGLVPRAKGLGRTFAIGGAVTLWPRRWRVEFADMPGPGQRIVYDRGRVGIDDALPEVDHRRTFRGLRKLRRWRPVDAAYFFGYALTTYFSAPFVLPACDILRAQRREAPVPIIGLTVRFPPDWHTHAPVQRFWFDPTGLLVRHDYHAEILGPLAYGAHYSRDYVEVDGLLVARARDVYLAVGPYPRVARTTAPILQGRIEPRGVRYDDATAPPRQEDSA